MDVKDRKAIVTGGVKGLGRAMVESLRREGSAVAVLDMDADGLAELTRRCPEVCGEVCDVSDPAQVGPAVERCCARLGGVDILINNAGILYSSPLVRVGAGGLETHSLDMWQKVLAADLNSVFYVTLAVVERMIRKRTRGVVVNISSVSAAGNAGQSAYSAAKAGVNALTATWAKELGPLGIRVVAVAPGYTTTESTRAAMNEEALKDVARRMPLRRLGEPAEIAAAVLAVIQNDFFNGKVVPVDGGLVI